MEKEIPTLPLITEDDKTKYKNWWDALSDNWKKAFNKAVFNKEEVIDDLSDEELHQVWHSSILRFAGPRALHPNLTFELGNLKPLKDFKQLKTLVVISSNITSLKPIAKLTQLEGLFVFDNQIKSLEGIENLTKITQFYFQDNRIDSLEPLENLTKLKDLYACRNRFKSLNGIGKKNTKCLETFRVLPNPKLKQKEILKFERKIGIRCLQG